MEKKILITGGAGFVGTNFVARLFQRYPEYHVVVLDALTYAGNLENFTPQIKNDARFTFYRGDVRGLGMVMELISKVNLIVHVKDI